MAGGRSGGDLFNWCKVYRSLWKLAGVVVWSWEGSEAVGFNLSWRGAGCLCWQVLLARLLGSCQGAALLTCAIYHLLCWFCAARSSAAVFLSRSPAPTSSCCGLWVICRNTPALPSVITKSCKQHSFPFLPLSC